MASFTSACSGAGVADASARPGPTASTGWRPSRSIAYRGNTLFRSSRSWAGACASAGWEAGSLDGAWACTVLPAASTASTVRRRAQSCFAFEGFLRDIMVSISSD